MAWVALKIQPRRHVAPSGNCARPQSPRTPAERIPGSGTGATAPPAPLERGSGAAVRVPTAAAAVAAAAPPVEYAGGGRDWAP